MENTAPEQFSLGGDASRRTYQPQSAKRSGKRFFVALLIVLLIGAAFFGGAKFLGKKLEKPAPKVTPTPTEVVFPTDTPTPSPQVSPTPAAKPQTKDTTPTPRPTQNPVDKATGIDRSTLSVEVQNGSGEKGVASEGSEVLKAFGYHVVAVGNANNFDYANVVIRVKASVSKFLPLLKSDLARQYTVGSASEDLSASTSADAVVIIGK